MSDVVYGRTPTGQLVYDLAFTNLADSYLARKHRIPVGEIRKYRAGKEMAKLRTQNGLQKAPKKRKRK